jgi:hypothetical protein
MDRLLRGLAALVRGLAGLLADGRRDWVHALLVEAGQVPARPARLAWLAGGLWLVVREVVMNRVIQVLAFVAGAVGLVWIGWPGASTNSATPVNRMYVVGTLVLLAGLPALVRRYLGPVRPGWAPRAARIGGYAVVLALVAAVAVKHRIGSQLGVYFPVVAGVWAMYVGFLLILAGYVAGLLILTCRRVQFTRRVLPLAVSVGVLTAAVLYLLVPYGADDAIERATGDWGRATVADYLLLGCFALAALAVPVAVHAVTSRLADRDGRPGILAPTRQAVLATTCAMATAAMLVALFTSLTIALRPDGVPQQPVGDGFCHNCEPPTIVVPPNLRHEYEAEGSVGHAGGSTLLALLIVPLVGAAIAAGRNPVPPSRSAGVQQSSRT